MDTASARIIIIRHGNTFERGETPRRVGARTDLPLTAEGRAQIIHLADHLASENLMAEHVICSPLSRTQQSGEILCTRFGLKSGPDVADWLREIDYGPDENKTDDVVIRRIGHEALYAWEHAGIIPDGWSPDAHSITCGWQNFAASCKGSIALVTSNGIARFAGVLTGDFPHFAKQHGLRMHTGAYSLLERSQPDASWRVVLWNRRP